MSRLDDIAARVEAATPGEWKLDGRTAWAPTEDGTQNRFWATVQGVYPVHVKRDELDANAALIANAPADLRYLVAIARAAERLAMTVAAFDRGHADGCYAESPGMYDSPCSCGRADIFQAFGYVRAALESKEGVR